MAERKREANTQSMHTRLSLSVHTHQRCLSLVSMQHCDGRHCHSMDRSWTSLSTSTVGHLVAPATDEFHGHCSREDHCEANTTEERRNESHGQETHIATRDWRSRIALEWRNRNILFHWAERVGLHRNSSNRMKPGRCESAEWDLQGWQTRMRLVNVSSTIYIEGFDEERCLFLDSVDSKWIRDGIEANPEYSSRVATI